MVIIHMHDKSPSHDDMQIIAGNGIVSYMLGLVIIMYVICDYIDKWDQKCNTIEHKVSWLNRGQAWDIGLVVLQIQR